MKFKWLWILLAGLGSVLLLVPVVWTAMHSILFTGCLLLVVSLFAIVAVWGNQSERL